MTNEELTEIKEARAEITKAGQYRDLDIIGWHTIGVAAEALDRLTPEKPYMKAMEGFDPEVASHLVCPNCDGPVTNYWKPGLTPKHCQFCGQALEWKWGDEK